MKTHIKLTMMAIAAISAVSCTGNKSEAANAALRKAVDTINKKMVHTECQFGFHDATNRIMIKIIDKDTKEVLKEFPPEETLEMIAKAWELAGILMDEKL